jgi:ribonuclease P protein component
MQRLQTRAQFQAVLAGATVARTAHFALHRCALDLASSAQPLFASDDVWLGAMVPKRWARRAVTRNAIKRQIYTVSAAPGVALPRAAHVVRLRRVSTARNS